MVNVTEKTGFLGFKPKHNKIAGGKGLRRFLLSGFGPGLPEGGFCFPGAHTSAKMTIVRDVFRVWILAFSKGKHYGFYA